MKTICNRRPKTDNKKFIENKLAAKEINSAAIKYGRRNEDIAIKCYSEHQQKKGLILNIKKCGLFINPALPWLATTPDSIVEIGPDTGCLEVKYPLVCVLRSLLLQPLSKYLLFALKRTMKSCS